MKNFLIFLAFICLCSILMSCSDSTKSKLYIYNWSDYLAPEIVTGFEKKYNCEIIFDYYDSNEAMYAKLREGGNSYDIIFPSSYMADIMFKQKMITLLDHNKIPNCRFIDKTYTDKIQDKRMKYSIPYIVSFTGLGYNKKRVRDIKPTWGMFSDNRYSHRMTMFDDMREAIGAALKYLGYSLNSINDEELDRAKNQMLKWKKNLAAYQVDEAKTSLGAGILLLIQAYNGDIYQVADDNPLIDFIVPEEGTSIGVDTLVIPSGGSNPELAYKFVNYLCDPNNAAANMNYLYYLAPNVEGVKLLDRNFYSKLVIPEDILKKSEVIFDLGQNNEKYIQMWDEIKAASI